MPPGILERIETKLDELLKNGGKAATGDEDGDEGDEDKDEEDPKPKTRTRTRTSSSGKDKAPTMADVKAKIKAVLDKKGRKTAVAILEEFDVEKVGDLEEDQFVKFIKACDKAVGGAKDDDEDDDL